MGIRRVGALGLGVTALVLLAAGCGMGASSRSANTTATHGQVAAGTTAAGGTGTTGTTIATTTTAPCALSGSPGSGSTVPVNEVCSASGAPHFDTPEAAMTYLASAWNAGNVQEIDYVTDPAGRQQMDSMASLMMNLQFRYCTRNPAGDYTCYFMHDIAASSSSTTYPNPANYPPGEAVFTVAPAATPGWYLTNVIHCG
jgi:hypothetical protein